MLFASNNKLNINWKLTLDDLFQMKSWLFINFFKVTLEILNESIFILLALKMECILSELTERTFPYVDREIERPWRISVVLERVLILLPLSKVLFWAFAVLYVGCA